MSYTQSNVMIHSVLETGLLSAVNNSSYLERVVFMCMKSHNNVELHC